MAIRKPVSGTACPGIPAATQPASRATRPGVAPRTAIRGVLAAAVLGAAFFGPAGTFAYWQAWVYMAILAVLAGAVLFYLVRNSPDLLERRMRMRERETAQRWVIVLSYVPTIAAFLLPGFDRRWGWSHVPPPVVVAADLVLVLGCVLYGLVLKENRYASRVVEVERDQQVTRTGPYALVRHPMYLAVLLIYMATPPALGSWWAMLPAAIIVPALVARILNEEKVLARGLHGYREYAQVTRYHLLPGVW